MRSSTDTRLTRIGETYSGCMVWASSLRSTLPMTRWRTTLIDPAVEPAEPPGNMSATMIMAANGATASQVL